MTETDPIAVAADGVLLREASGAVRTERDVVVARGPDVVSYLQGQLSQDVAALAVGDSAWSFVLQPQGKVDGWFRISRTGDDAVVLDTEPGAGAALLARLERFRLRMQVEFSLDRWAMVALRGPAVPPPAQLRGAGAGDGPGAGVDDGAGAGAGAGAGDGAGDGAGAGAEADRAPLVVAVAWNAAVGVDLLGPEVAVPDGVPVCSAEALDALRIDAGIPAMGSELDADTIPGEAGAEVIARSVSFTKGCYTGQELVARIDSRGGRTPRRIAHLTVADGRPAPGAAVVVDGTEVGVVTSSAMSVEGGVALVSVVRSLETPVAVVVDVAGEVCTGVVRELGAAGDVVAPSPGSTAPVGGEDPGDAAG